MPPTRDEMEKAVDEHMPIALGKVSMKESDYSSKKKKEVSRKPTRKREEKPVKKTAKEPVKKLEKKPEPKVESRHKEVVSDTKMISMRMPNRQIDILEKYGVARTSAIIIALDQLFKNNGWR